MSRLQEINELIRYRWRTPKVAKRLVIYAEHEGYYAYFEGLVEELTARRMRSLCYVTSDPTDPILRSNRPGVHPFYLSRLLPYFLMAVNCRVMVMTMTDLHRFHLKRSAHPVHYVYLFHSLVSTHMMYRQGAFDHYDSYLCPGPAHRRELEQQFRVSGISDKVFVDSGYYRLERIHAAGQDRSGEVRGQTERVTILIAPSWGDQNLLKAHGKELVANLLAADYRVIVRPHPETVRRDPALLTELNTTFNADQRFTLETSVSTDDSLLAADLMICDLSGVALEYALGLERPVLFVDLPPKVKNEAYAELGLEPIELSLREKLGRVIAPSELTEVSTFVGEMLADRDRYRSDLAEFRQATVFNFGRSSLVEADYIESLLDTDHDEGDRP